jgi:deazaflavin-dependent oxidoreductase (nitroreductase family)
VLLVLVSDETKTYNDFNQKIIDEFREYAGKVGGPFEGAPMLLLHTKGAKTGRDLVHPVVYQDDDGRLVIFASKGGAPTNPSWFHNLRANPRATVEVGTDTFEVNARVAEGDERERIWTKQKKIMPGFADYEKNTTRQIPVIILERV